MKKTILAAAFIAFMGISTSTFAQDGPPRDRQGQGRFMMSEKMYDSLGLNDDQKTKLKALNEANRNEMMAVRNDASLSDEQKRDKMIEMRKAQKAKRDAILTPEQSKKLDAKFEEMRRNRPQRQDSKQ